MSTLNETSLLSLSENYIVKNLCNVDEYSIDIGAARGDFASQMSLYSKFVYAIEPNPIKIKHLIASKNNIQLFENAASSSHGKNVELRVVSATPANSTIEILNKLEGFDGIEFRNVKTIKIDEICKHSTSFMKIDCEGHDLEVLYGSEELITNSKPSILIELRDKHNPGYLVKTFLYLLKMKYLPFFVSENSINEINFENGLFETLEDIISKQENDQNLTQDNFLFLNRSNHIKVISNYM
jgi:FkbM family methyltransferase